MQIKPARATALGQTDLPYRSVTLQGDEKVCVLPHWTHALNFADLSRFRAAGAAESSLSLLGRQPLLSHFNSIKICSRGTPSSSRPRSATTGRSLRMPSFASRRKTLDCCKFSPRSYTAAGSTPDPSQARQTRLRMEQPAVRKSTPSWRLGNLQMTRSMTPNGTN